MRSSQMLTLGQPAPDFTAPATGGTEPLRLSALRGQCITILAFYPGDWTDICTQELPLFDESYTLTDDLNVQVIGISVDSVASHVAYAQHLGLSRVRLVSDFDRQISAAYGVLRPEGMCERATFVIDQEGTIYWQRVESELHKTRPLGTVRQVVATLRGRPDLATPQPDECFDEAQLVRATPLEPPTLMNLKFWGTRGSIPICGPAYTRYGGNTSCVSLQSDTGHLFIFDSGSGIRELGIALQREMAADPAQAGVMGYLLLSHTHWDHIQGFPFFEPAFNPRNHFSIIGCNDCAQKLAVLLAGQMERTYFPITMDGLPARIRFSSYCNTTFTLDDAQITTLTLKHPNPSTAFRVDLAGRSVVYATDHEMLRPLTTPPGDTLIGTDVIDTRLLALAAGADILIHDAQYTLTEYPHKVEWGHSTVESAVDTAIHAGVRRLFLFHHDPQHTDGDLDAMLTSARRRAARLAPNRLEVYAAADGEEWVW